MLVLLVVSTRFHLQGLSNPNDIYNHSGYNTTDGIRIDYPSYFIFKVWYIAANILMTISNWYVPTSLMLFIPAVNQSVKDFKQWQRW